MRKETSDVTIPMSEGIKHLYAIERYMVSLLEVEI